MRTKLDFVWSSWTCRHLKLLLYIESKIKSSELTISSRKLMAFLRSGLVSQYIRNNWRPIGCCITMYLYDRPETQKRIKLCKNNPIWQYEMHIYEQYFQSSNTKLHKVTKTKFSDKFDNFLEIFDNSHQYFYEIDLSTYRIAYLTLPCPLHKNLNIKTLTFC